MEYIEIPGIIMFQCFMKFCEEKNILYVYILYCIYIIFSKMHRCLDKLLRVPQDIVKHWT